MVGLEAWFIVLLGLVGTLEAKGHEVRLLEVDIYNAHGLESVTALLNSKEKFYPSSAKQALQSLFRPSSGSTCGNFDAIWRFRAYCAWPFIAQIGMSDDNHVHTGFTRVQELLAGNGVAAISNPNKLPPTPVMESNKPAAFYAFGGPEECTRLSALVGQRVATGSEYQKLDGQNDRMSILLLTKTGCSDCPEWIDQCPKQTIVFVAPSIGEFKNAGFHKAMHWCIENGPLGIFALESELQDLGNLFHTNPTTDLVQIAKAQQAPFPRLHFATLHTALGETIADSSILTAPLSVGAHVPLDSAKFASANPVILTKSDGSLLIERVIGDSGVGVSLITPALIICQVLTSIAEGSDLQEATSNIEDLCMEYEQYHGAWSTASEEEE